MSQLCITGDVHGHLQLALGVAARWQQELGTRFDNVLICGDVGTFTRRSQLDSATIRHARENPCELEFLEQWMREDAACWLRLIFEPVEKGGLGLPAPAIMTHGNHEGFDHLIDFRKPVIPERLVPVDELPRIDRGGWIAYLPCSWRARTAGGAVVGAIGGIEPGQRHGYHPMAYIDRDLVWRMAEGDAVDVLITHQGPARLQGSDCGSDLLDLILEAGIARSWFHGHSIHEPEMWQIGPTTVVPLQDVPFQTKGEHAGQPQPDSFAHVSVGEGSVEIDRQRPGCWWEFHQSNWMRIPDGRLVAPPLAWAAADVWPSGRK